MGYNSDVRHRGVIVHIQTEDQGVNAAKIETQVFFSGTILDSRILSYSELVESSSSEDELNQEVQRRMKALHKYFHNQIQRGTYDHRLPIAEQAPPADEAVAADAPDAAPIEPPTAAPAATTSSPALARAQLEESRARAFLGIDHPRSTALGEAMLAML